MKRIILATSVLTVSILLWSHPVMVLGEPIPGVLITELQTSNKTAGEEFIELYNNTDYDIDFADTIHQGKNIWKLQFFSSTKVTANGFAWEPKTSGLTTVSLTRTDNTPVTIAAHSYFLISTAGYSPGDIEPDFTYSSGHMSDTGGGIQLVSVSGTSTAQVITAQDHLGWFNPTISQALPTDFYLTPSALGSLQRLTVNDSYIDSDQLISFVASSEISPKEAWVLPVEQDSEPLAVDTSDNTDTSELMVESVEQASEISNLLPIQITELLPNPASPQTDDKNEYIELFNPNDQVVSLNGYSLQAGLKFSYSYTLQDTVINPQSYLVLTSENTNLSLANSAGQARLLDTSGQVVSQTEAYELAPDGQAWAVAGGIWQWTATPTIAAENVMSSPAVKSIAQPKAIAKNTAVKAVAAKKVVASKPKTTASKAKKTPKVSVASKASGALGKVPPAALHKSILVGVGTLAVVYGLYEYRTDMANKLYQFRRNRATRRENRQAAQGAGGD